jgi:hypothetical protein
VRSPWGAWSCSRRESTPWEAAKRRSRLVSSPWGLPCWPRWWSSRSPVRELARVAAGGRYPACGRLPPSLGGAGRRRFPKRKRRDGVRGYMLVTWGLHMGEDNTVVMVTECMHLSWQEGGEVASRVNYTVNRPVSGKEKTGPVYRWNRLVHRGI